MISAINMFLPTYGRVKGGKLEAHLNSAINNVSNMNNICYTFLVNINDNETIKFIDNADLPFSYEVLYEDTKTPNLAAYYNHIYENTTFNGDHIAVSMIGDDMTWETKDFDLHIMDAINKKDGYCVAYCNDMFIMQEKMAVNLFTTRKMVDACGSSFMCEDYPVDIIDAVWTDIGRFTKTLTYLNDVILRHNHNTAVPLEQRDATYKRLREFFHISTANLPQYKEHVHRAVINFNKVVNNGS